MGIFILFLVMVNCLHTTRVFLSLIELSSLIYRCQKRRTFCVHRQFIYLWRLKLLLFIYLLWWLCWLVLLRWNIGVSNLTWILSTFFCILLLLNGITITLSWIGCFLNIFAFGVSSFRPMIGMLMINLR